MTEQTALQNMTLDELSNSEEYAAYLIEHTDRMIGNGDMLLLAMEDQELFNDFLESIGVDPETHE